MYFEGDYHLEQFTEEDCQEELVGERVHSVDSVDKLDCHILSLRQDFLHDVTKLELELTALLAAVLRQHTQQQLLVGTVLTDGRAH